MKLSRVLLSGMVGIMLFTSQGYAASVQVLSLNEALTLATTNDPELKLWEEKIALAEKELVQVNANAAYKRTETVNDYDKAGYVIYRKSYLLTPIKKEHAVAALKRQRDQKISDIKIDLMTQYYDVQSKLDALEDAKRSLETLDKELSAKKAELELGKITQLDYNSYEIKKLEMASQIKKAETELSVSYMKFANIANKPLDFKFTPNKVSEAIKRFEVSDLNQLYTTEKSKNHELINKSDAINEMEIEIKINTESQYEIGNTDSATNVLQRDLKSAQKDLSDIETNIQLNLNLDYYRLLSLYDTILVSKSSQEIAKLEYDIAKVKYSVGTISLLDYLGKKEALDKAESQYRNGIQIYQVAVEKFKMNYHTN